MRHYYDFDINNDDDNDNLDDDEEGVLTKHDDDDENVTYQFFYCHKSLISFSLFI